MAPLSRALDDLKLAQRDSGTSSSKYTYQGVVDPDWAAGPLPNGGYVLCLLVMVGIKSRHETKHQDPIHVTAHFVAPTKISPYEIQLEIIRTGTRFTNLSANWIQDGEIKVTTHMIFGTLPDFKAPPSSKEYEDIPPSHPLYHHIPILTHPSDSPLENVDTDRYKFIKHLRRAEDPLIKARNKAKLTAPQGGLESGLWVELVDEDKELVLAMFPLFADMFRRTPTLLSQVHGNGNLPKYYPTVLMTLEFKRRLPYGAKTSNFAKRTLGLFSRGLFLEHGRHDTYCEIWSAPCDLGQATGGEKQTDKESWRRDMRCIAVTTQMALTISLNGQKKPAKL
ncbi:hypothetical protein FRC09_005598 [Ceratobasidium sp. 395]|nr:hypothetical protein FRC09_005598 [Ceratobasidium sp. 395]